MIIRNSITTVHDTYLPIYRFSQPLGFACFRRHRRQFCAQTSWLGVFFVLLNVGLIIADIYNHTVRDDYHEYEDNNLLGLGNQYSVYSCIATLLVGNVTAICRHRRIAGFLQQLHHIDKQLAVLGEPVNNRRHYRVVLTVCVACMVHTAIVCSSASWISPTMCTNDTWNTALEMFTYGYFSLAYGVAMGNIVFVYEAVRVRLAVLNRRIGAIDSQTSVATAKLMARTFEKLNGLCEQANSCFSLLVLTGIVSAMISHTVCMFTTYMLYPNTAELSTLLIWTEMFWNCSTLSWLLMLAYAGHSMVTVSRRTGRIIHKVVNGDDRNGGSDQMRDVDRQLGHFSRQTLHSYPVVSCGLFSLDWKMVHVVRISHFDYSAIRCIHFLHAF